MRRQERLSGWVMGIGAALVAIAAVLAIVAGYGRASGRDAADCIAIVSAPGVGAAIAAPVRAAAPTRTEIAAPSAERAIADLRRAYPMLASTTIECSGVGCTLSGTIVPPTGQADLDKRQEMLLGGLKSMLAADGYDMRVPFQMDEIDFNRFRIQAALTPIQSRSDR